MRIELRSTDSPLGSSFKAELRSVGGDLRVGLAADDEALKAGVRGREPLLTLRVELVGERPLVGRHRCMYRITSCASAQKTGEGPRR
jgi:hypothetical protein